MTSTETSKTQAAWALIREFRLRERK